MGLSSTIATAVTSAWTALGDIPLSATYYQQSGDIAYNTTTGAVTRTETQVAVTVVRDDYREDETDGANVRINDRRFLVRASQLGITPREHDRIVVGGISYEVIRITADPATAVWIIQARGVA